MGRPGSSRHRAEHRKLISSFSQPQQRGQRRPQPRGPGVATAACAMRGSAACPGAVPRHGCVSAAERHPESAALPAPLRDVSGSGSRSVCRAAVTQPVSAAGRGPEVVSYLLSVAKVLTGPTSCLRWEASSVFHTARSSCAMHTMQACNRAGLSLRS